jgi:hypothetical protein
LIRKILRERRPLADRRSAGENQRVLGRRIRLVHPFISGDFLFPLGKVVAGAGQFVFGFLGEHAVFCDAQRLRGGNIAFRESLRGGS